MAVPLVLIPEARAASFPTGFGTTCTDNVCHDDGSTFHCDVHDGDCAETVIVVENYDSGSIFEAWGWYEGVVFCCVSGGQYTDTGNEGNDELYGNAGGDTLLGGTGDDVLHGGDDDDRLFGEDGSDVLCGDGQVAGDYLRDGDDGDTNKLWGAVSADYDQCDSTDTLWDGFANTGGCDDDYILASIPVKCQN